MHRMWTWLRRNRLKPARSASLTAVPHTKWADFLRDRRVSLPPRPLFDRRDTFFTIGSCFAEEIRNALAGRGVTCLPDYRSIVFDRARARIDNLPDREHMNYYNTFSIRQEIERAAGLWTQDESDIWTIGRRALAKTAFAGGTAFQDPYRRLTVGASPSDLHSVLASVNTVMAEGMKSASAVIMTLGLTEVFVKKDNGLVANRFPGYGRGGGESQTAFHASTFAENLDNVERSIGLLKQLNPTVKIVITVSPVPLARTFSGHDVYVANTQSKSILVAAAQEACSRLDDCYYFPSYEIVSSIGAAAFKERDGRHVTSDIVDSVVEAFVAATFSLDTADRRRATSTAGAAILTGST
jgi:hypothetical protein